MSLEDDISCLRYAEMSDWRAIFLDFQSVNQILERVQAMWRENKMFLQDDSRELFMHFHDICYKLQEITLLLKKMSQEVVLGLEVAEDRVANVRQNAMGEFVSLRKDYMEWRDAIEECCQTSLHSGWNDPIPTFNDVHNTGNNDTIDTSLDSRIDSSNVRLNE